MYGKVLILWVGYSWRGLLNEEGIMRVLPIIILFRINENAYSNKMLIKLIEIIKYLTWERIKESAKGKIRIMDMFNWKRDWKWEVKANAKIRLIRGLEGEYEHKWVWARFWIWARFREWGRSYRGRYLNLGGWWSSWLGSFGFIFWIKVSFHAIALIKRRLSSSLFRLLKHFRWNNNDWRIYKLMACWFN